MNAGLRHVPDGTGATLEDEVGFQTTGISALTGRPSRGWEHGEIWWPFAIHNAVDLGTKWVTHLSSGYKFGSHGLTVDDARALVQELRALPLDWDFEKPTGPKWDAIKTSARPTLERFGMISPKAQAI